MAVGETCSANKVYGLGAQVQPVSLKLAPGAEKRRPLAQPTQPHRRTAHRARPGLAAIDLEPLLEVAGAVAGAAKIAQGNALRSCTQCVQALVLMLFVWVPVIYFLTRQKLLSAF